MRFAHASGEFNKSPALLRESCIQRLNYADVVTLTEVSDPARRNALFGLGAKVLTGKGEGDGECAILVNEARFEIVEFVAKPLTRGGGLRRLSAPIHAATALLRERDTDLGLIVSATHQPARVELLLRARARRIIPASVWVESVSAWGFHIRDFRRQVVKDRDAHPKVWMAADWNVDGHNGWCRDLINERLPADLKLRVPKQGTHGHRAIDFFATNMMMKSPVVTASTKSSDHRAVLGHARLSAK